MSRAFNFDDIYQSYYTALSCAHERRAQWHALCVELALLIGIVTVARRLWTVSLDSMHTEASFLPNSMDWLCLRVPWIPTSQDMTIFVLTTTTRMIALPLAHARGVIS